MHYLKSGKRKSVRIASLNFSSRVDFTHYNPLSGRKGKEILIFSTYVVCTSVVTNIPMLRFDTLFDQFKDKISVFVFKSELYQKPDQRFAVSDPKNHNFDRGFTLFSHIQNEPSCDPSLSGGGDERTWLTISETGLQHFEIPDPSWSEDDPTKVTIESCAFEING